MAGRRPSRADEFALALKVLAYLQGQRKTQDEVAAHITRSRITTYRLLRRLLALKLIDRDPKRGGRQGASAHTYGATVQVSKIPKP